MVEVKKAVLKAVADLSRETAINAGGAISHFLCYQPKEPASLKKYVKSELF